MQYSNTINLCSAEEYKVSNTLLCIINFAKLCAPC